MRINWNDGGFRALLKAPGVQAEVAARAEATKARLGSGYRVTIVPSPRNRARAQVWAMSTGAKRAALRDNTIIGALR